MFNNTGVHICKRKSWRHIITVAWLITIPVVRFNNYRHISLYMHINYNIVLLWDANFLIMDWISNRTHSLIRHAITDPSPNFNGGLTNLPFRLGYGWEIISHIFMWMYSISQEICTQFCCALLCSGYAIVHNEFTWSIYPYSWGLLCWHWGNR